MADLASSDELKSTDRVATLRTLVIHLRLHFQILLAPIFLWGFFLAGGKPDGTFWIAFVAFHLFLYGGATAYNSYYDHDEGPVGGLAQPPPVLPVMLPFAVLVQLIGLLLSAVVGWTFLAIYVAIFVLFTAYSHPLTRLKGRPFWALATIGLGQGVLASLGGWVSAGASLTALDLTAWSGVLAATLITIGFYPLTQIYQIDEDRARGDLTFAAWAGPRRSFHFAMVVQALAAVILVSVIGQVLGPLKALLVGVFYCLLLAATLHWSYTFDSRQVLANYRRVMRINTLTSLGFLAFLGLHLFDILGR